MRVVTNVELKVDSVTKKVVLRTQFNDGTCCESAVQFANGNEEFTVTDDKANDFTVTV